MRVTIEGLVFERDGHRVLDVPALTFANGATTAIFGPNGSGKTTLLRLIAALERPSAGSVRLGDAEARPDVATRARIAYAFQEAVFLRGSVRENLALGLTLRGMPTREREARITAVAPECGIAALLERPAQRLSGGEAQRVNLARALALRAPLTLLDEPLAGLDRHGRTRLLDELPALLERFAATTILVTHDREEAFRLADHLVVLIDGAVRAAGPKGEVYRRPPDREVAELLGYTVLDAAGALVAIPPGGLRLGPGRLAFQMRVDRVVDMGDHRHALGEIVQRRVDVRLHSRDMPPRPGAVTVVAADYYVRIASATTPAPDPREGARM